MKKAMIHALAGTIALLSIATFWLSTLISELFLGSGAIVIVKHAIAVYGLMALVPAMAATGGSGFSLAKVRKGRLIYAKKKRMALIAFNGILIMVPVALFLDHKAATGEFDATFYAVQMLELLVGLVQLTLIGMNFRDGLKLRGRLLP
jgi:hypothetical protein